MFLIDRNVLTVGHGEPENLHGYDDGGGQSSDWTPIHLLNSTGHEVNKHSFIHSFNYFKVIQHILSTVMSALETFL